MAYGAHFIRHGHAYAVPRQSYTPCPACGTNNDPGSAFCGHCARPLTQASPISAVGPSCLYCSATLNENSAYCGSCGKQAMCLRCGAQIAAQAKFCRGCGQALSYGG